MTDQEMNGSFDFEGKVKWFDLVKKYGFITDTNRGIDIYIPLDMLVQYGIFCLSKDSYIEGEAKKNGHGFIVTDITALDPEIKLFDLKASRKLSEEFSTIPVENGPVSTKTKGSVSSYNDQRGFGFISVPKIEKNIFFHISCVEKCGIPVESLTPGRKVYLSFVQNEKGLIASDIELS